MEKTAPIRVSAGETARPVTLQGLVIDVRDGQRVGTMSILQNCANPTPFMHNGQTELLPPREAAVVFWEELRKAGYAVSGDPNRFFESRDDTPADFAVGGIVTNVEMALCFPSGRPRVAAVRGEMLVDIKWEVYDRFERSVVGTVASRGAARQEGREAGGVAQLFSLAFASATRNLLAEPGFHRIVVSPRATAVAAAPPSIRLVGVTRSSAPIASGIEAVQRAVVTVRGGDGHGSGFYVGNDGYVVTNHHVVGSARRVKLRHHDGRELDGEVVATDDWRDVALVRAAAAASRPLPVQRDIPPVGAEVYAVGSPLTARLQSTVTRGIVSSLRRIEGLSMIQSDVAIQPGNSGGPLLDARGNVVGIAVAGHRRAAGLNFFIPIGDALDRLGVVMD